MRRVCKTSREWDGRVSLLQVTDATEHAVQLRVLVSSADSPRNWDLRCLVREALVSFIQREYPQYLPTVRAVVARNAASPRALTPAEVEAAQG